MIDFGNGRRLWLAGLIWREAAWVSFFALFARLRAREPERTAIPTMLREEVRKQVFGEDADVASDMAI